MSKVVKEYKHLRIKEDTHRMVKAYASIEGLGHDDMIKKLIQCYKDNGNKPTKLKKYGR